MQKRARHQGQNHDTRVMGVVHGTTGTAHYEAETGGSSKCGCVSNVACGKRTSCQWDSAIEGRCRVLDMWRQCEVTGKLVARTQGHRKNRRMTGRKGRHLQCAPPPGPHVEVVALAFTTCTAPAVVCNAGHLATWTAVYLQGLRQTEFNSCEAVVVGHDGGGVQVRVTEGPQHTQRCVIRVKGTNAVLVEPPITNGDPSPRPQQTPHPVGAQQPPVHA